MPNVVMSQMLAHAKYHNQTVISACTDGIKVDRSEVDGEYLEAIADNDWTIDNDGNIRVIVKDIFADMPDANDTRWTK